MAIQERITPGRIIAIDGPSGSGKSSVSKRVGRALGFLHVDSGALYRIMTWCCLQRGIDGTDPRAVESFSGQVRVEFSASGGEILYAVDGRVLTDEIRTPEINARISPISAIPAVRRRITAWLRALPSFGDLIIEGRDITTAVFPDTPARFFLTASAEARALRRPREEVEKGIARQSEEEVKASLLARDKIDSTRKCAPLRKADGVIEIDSTALSLDEVVERVISLLPAGWEVR